MGTGDWRWVLMLSQQMLELSPKPSQTQHWKVGFDCRIVVAFITMLPPRWMQIPAGTEALGMLWNWKTDLSLIYFDLCHIPMEAGVLISKSMGQDLWEQSGNRNHLARVPHYAYKSASACNCSYNLVDLYFVHCFIFFKLHPLNLTSDLIKDG